MPAVAWAYPDPPPTAAQRPDPNQRAASCVRRPGTRG
jgi:hypothetical protein